MIDETIVEVSLPEKSAALLKLKSGSFSLSADQRSSNTLLLTIPTPASSRKIQSSGERKTKIDQNQGPGDVWRSEFLLSFRSKMHTNSILTDFVLNIFTQDVS